MSRKIIITTLLWLWAGCAVSTVPADDEPDATKTSCSASCSSDGSCVEAPAQCATSCEPATDADCAQSTACAERDLCCMSVWTVADGQQGCTGCSPC